MPNEDNKKSEILISTRLTTDFTLKLKANQKTSAGELFKNTVENSKSTEDTSKKQSKKEK